jgi:hypothetical protein
MPFPGYPLPGGRTNATPQVDTHPADHNSYAAACNDLQAQIDAAVLNAISKLLIDAKGDLLVGTAADTIARQAVGADKLSLIADSTQTNGMKWGTPQSGMVQYAEITTGINPLPTAAGTPVAGLSVTATFDATHRYIVRAKLGLQSSVAGDVIRVLLLDNGGQTDLGQMNIDTANSFHGPLVTEKIFTGTSGAHTFTVDVYRLAGTGVCQIVAQTGIRSYIYIRDDGVV